MGAGEPGPTRTRLGQVGPATLSKAPVLLAHPLASAMSCPEANEGALVLTVWGNSSLPLSRPSADSVSAQWDSLRQTPKTPGT